MTLYVLHVRSSLIMYNTQSTSIYKPIFIVEILHFHEEFYKNPSLERSSNVRRSKNTTENEVYL
jgi:hypothetical protein